jgi:diguanylate cyclase (GGDEF)-like protein
MTRQPSRHRNGLLEAALQALPVGVALHDAQGGCVMANALMRSRAGELTEDLLGPVFLNESEECNTYNFSGREFEVKSRNLVVGDADGQSENFRLTTAIDITAHHRLQRELIERAYLDELTQLPNRTLFEQTINELISDRFSNASFAIAFFDLDNFKHINDYYSHSAGDALLIKFADRIRSLITPADMLARVGGDEFVLLLNQVKTAQEAHSQIVHIAERLKQPFFIDGHEVFASASVGLSLFPDHGRTYELLRRRADSAMYRVKADIKGSVSLFDETMAQAATERMAVEQRLRLAIRDRCFRCAYQPKVDLRTGAIQGIEVLLRWRDQEGIIRAPGAFIGLAIELGLINEITLQVLGEVVQSIPQIDALFGSQVTISINIAARQAGDVTFMKGFCEALLATGCASRFTLELTEEAFLTKGHFQREVLPQIRSIGAKVSIDDFGVGYSSLAALAEITADELKIDRSFISDIHLRPRSQIVLKAIESLGEALGMTIIAEGVEKFEEVAYLQAATRIRYAQGYYFDKPLILDGLNIKLQNYDQQNEAYRIRA